MSCHRGPVSCKEIQILSPNFVAYCYCRLDIAVFKLYMVKNHIFSQDVDSSKSVENTFFKKKLQNLTL